MSQKLPNRIPSEELESVNSWLLPEIDADGNVLPSAEKEARDRELEQHRRETEVVEELDSEQLTLEPFTAQQLQEMTEAAEKEGYEQGHQEGYRDGQAEGYKVGQQQGAEEVRQQLLAEQQRLSQIADALLQPLAPQDEAIEQSLLDIVCTLARSVIKRELYTESNHILTLVQEAVAALPVGAKNLKVVLNPDDLALVESFAEERQKDWQFMGDAELLPGGCRIETSESLVDFSVENRMESLLQQFVNKQLAGADDEALPADTPVDSEAGSGQDGTQIPTEPQGSDAAPTPPVVDTPLSGDTPPVPE